MVSSSNPRQKSSTTRAERKFEKKLQFYAKVRDTVAALSAKKKIRKKRRRGSGKKNGRTFDLSTLSEFLPTLETPKPKVNFKSRNKLIMKEGERFKEVLDQPAFQINPLAAIHEHLLSTHPVFEDNPHRKRKKKKKPKK